MFGPLVGLGSTPSLKQEMKPVMSAVFTYVDLSVTRERGRDKEVDKD